MRKKSCLSSYKSAAGMFPDIQQRGIEVLFMFHFYNKNHLIEEEEEKKKKKILMFDILHLLNCQQLQDVLNLNSWSTIVCT